MNIEWFLRHRRNPNPRQVRIRSAELRNASAYWAQVHQAASPLAFMVVDAEVVDRNVIRLDTENVLDVVLSPSAALVDPSKPVRVVWNGVAQVVALAGREAAADRPRLRSRGGAQEPPPARNHRGLHRHSLCGRDRHRLQGSRDGGPLPAEGQGIRRRLA